MFFEDKYQISSGEDKGKREYGGEGQNKGYFAKHPILCKIQTLSHKMLVRQTSNHHHCNWYAQKPKVGDFQLMLSSSAWSKTTLGIVRNKHSFLKKNLCFDQEEMLKMA